MLVIRDTIVKINEFVPHKIEIKKYNPLPEILPPIRIFSPFGLFFYTSDPIFKNNIYGGLFTDFENFGYIVYYTGFYRRIIFNLMTVGTYMDSTLLYNMGTWLSIPVLNIRKQATLGFGTSVDNDFANFSTEFTFSSREYYPRSISYERGIYLDARINFVYTLPFQYAKMVEYRNWFDIYRIELRKYFRLYRHCVLATRINYANYNKFEQVDLPRFFIVNPLSEIYTPANQYLFISNEIRFPITYIYSGINLLFLPIFFEYIGGYLYTDIIAKERLDERSYFIACGGELGLKAHVFYLPFPVVRLGVIAVYDYKRSIVFPGISIGIGKGY